MLNKIKEFLYNEKLLWQAERNLTKTDLIIGITSCITFFVILLTYALHWDKIENLINSVTLFEGLLLIILFLGVPFAIFGIMMIHLEPPRK